MDDLDGVHASPSWRWSVTKFPRPDARKGVMYLLPEARQKRNGRPRTLPGALTPDRRDLWREPPNAPDDKELNVKRAEEGPSCVWCGKQHPQDGRHGKRP